MAGIASFLGSYVLTPNHQYISLKMQVLNGGKPANSEIINTGKATYIQHDGKWKPGVSAQAMLDQMNENPKDAKGTCHFVDTEGMHSDARYVYGAVSAPPLH